MQEIRKVSFEQTMWMLMLDYVSMIINYITININHSINQCENKKIL